MVKTTPSLDTTQTFDLATGRFVGWSETVNGGAICPFGGDAGKPILWLSAGKFVTPGYTLSRCTDGKGLPGHRSWLHDGRTTQCRPDTCA